MDNVTNPLENQDGPPPVEPTGKGQPHHVEARLAGLEPELKDMFEKNIADKVATERNYRNADAELRKTQQKLAEMVKEKQDAETARMVEQGKYKELAEASEKRAREADDKLFTFQVKSHLDRELDAAGAIDSDMMSAAVLAKYSDELRSNPDKATELVASLKVAKPLLFKQMVAADAADATPVPRSTGAPDTSPPAGKNPSTFDATDKSVPENEVKRRYKEAMKNVSWFS
jgi:hypothetical protein